ncbi:MAG: response regulator transcription factor [Gammaproteobacteria bacterium]
MDNSTPLVYVVDDDDAVRDSLLLLLRSIGINGRAFATAADFLDAYDPKQHSCLVTDIRMPGMSGLDLQRELKDRGAPIPIILITGHGDVPMAVDAMKEGALDFIEKPFRDQDLLDRVQQALTWDEEHRSKNLEALSIQERIATLTPREAEVMELVVQGCANKVIAQDLGVSQRTVEIHRARVMEKMGMRSLAALVRAVEKTRS